MQRAALWWLKRDFQLADNPALTAALDEAERVVPVFVVEPSLLDAAETSAFHVNAWLDAARELRARLRAVGSELLLLRAEAIEAFERARALWSFEAIYSHQETGSALTFQRDRAVARWCRETGIAWRELPQSGVFRGLRDRDERHRRWTAWTRAPLLPAPDAARLARTALPDALRPLAEAGWDRPDAYGFPSPPAGTGTTQPVSEAAGQATLTDFLSARGIGYSGGISSPNRAFRCGSRLSVHLAWGTLTARAAYQATRCRLDELKGSPEPDAARWRRSLTSFLSRLHWRDHFIQRLESEPEMEFRALNPAYEALVFDGPPEWLAAWRDGRTGFPLVDACMRCLRATGFINFRMRAMITSVACHTLHLDWRAIMRPMACLYADYEPGIHISQLQMQAGVVGINTLRVYNPAKQIQDHDPRATFVKTWLPELRDIAPERIVGHQASPVSAYVAPLTDWETSSREYRTRYMAVRWLAETRQSAAAVLAKHGSRLKRGARRS